MTGTFRYSDLPGAFGPGIDDKPKIPVVEKPRILVRAYGPGSGNHNGRHSTPTVRPWADTLRACKTEEEVTATLLWIVKHNPGASEGTRRKWRKVVEHVRERIRVEALTEGSKIVIPKLVMP